MGSGEFEDIPHIVRHVIRDRGWRGTKEMKRDRKPPPSASHDRELVGTATKQYGCSRVQSVRPVKR
jgi:hypothetical protein